MLLEDTAPALTPAQLDETEGRIDHWARAQLDENPIVVGVERGEPGQRRWYIRVEGEDKPVYAVWLTLHQRTLHYETYFLPAPPRHAEECYAMLLRRNAHLFGLAFAIGDEDAVYLLGRVPGRQVSGSELDRILGSIYVTVEECFRTALRISFTSDPE